MMFVSTSFCSLNDILQFSELSGAARVCVASAGPLPCGGDLDWTCLSSHTWSVKSSNRTDKSWISPLALRRSSCVLLSASATLCSSASALVLRSLTTDCRASSVTTGLFTKVSHNSPVTLLKASSVAVWICIPTCLISPRESFISLLSWACTSLTRWNLC